MPDARVSCLDWGVQDTSGVDAQISPAAIHKGMAC